MGKSALIMKYLFASIILLSSWCLMAQETTLGISEKQPDAPVVKREISKRQYKKTFRYKFYKHHEDLIDDFHDRQKAVAKREKKWERISKKPQYSDPSYFGHKRKPKIHAVSKRKLCKECNIVH